MMKERLLIRINLVLTQVLIAAILRVGFVKAIHMGDSLYVLTNGFEKMAPADLDTAEIIANYKSKN